MNFRLCANVKVSKGHFSLATHKPCSQELKTFVMQLNDGQYSCGHDLNSYFKYLVLETRVSSFDVPNPHGVKDDVDSGKVAQLH